MERLTEDLNIEIYYIPASATNVFQPLDRRVFGILKSQARRLFHRRVNENHLHWRTKSEACEDLMTAWAPLSHKVLLAGWDLYDEEGWTKKISQRVSSTNLHIHQ
jgi:hypothetical protein